MKNTLLEAVGIILLIAGLCVLVGAASLVSTALAVAVAGGFLVAAGVLVVLMANALQRQDAAKAAATAAGSRV